MVVYFNKIINEEDAYKYFTGWNFTGALCLTYKYGGDAYAN